MVQISTPLSFWIQLGSFFFTLAGVHGDLLVIRFFLVLAYLMLFMNAGLGSPLWPDAASPGSISVDSLVWSIIGLFVNGSSFVSLILDERKVVLTEDEAALWRMFYRTGGLSARLFKIIVAKHMQVVEFEAGDILPTENFFYILYKGRVHLEVYEDAEEKVHRTTVSGEMFDLKYLGMFSEESVFEAHKIHCRSLTKAKLFRFSRDDMKKIAHARFAKGVWQSLLINNLSFVCESYLEPNHRSRYAEHYCDKIFLPLEPWEKPKSFLAGSGAALLNPFWHLVYYIHRSFSPPWAHLTGIRQTELPPPAQRPSKTPQVPPQFHRLSSSIASFGKSSNSSRRFMPLWSFSAPRKTIDEEKQLAESSNVDDPPDSNDDPNF